MSAQVQKSPLDTDSQGHKQYAESAPNGTLCDTANKYWMLVDKTVVAVPKSSNTNPDIFTLMPNRDPTAVEKGKPVYIGIQNKDLCLCCEDSGGQPVLQVKDKKIMDLYHNGDKSNCFRFYQNKSGSDTHSFESVAHPGWFICTSPHTEEPVSLTDKRGETHFTDFCFELK
uniref:Interleukin-1 n=1 Tax=Ornithorhynchus anatinus TaxID=9258 RepID=A0A6I8NGX1_ORNAN